LYYFSQLHKQQELKANFITYGVSVKLALVSEHKFSGGYSAE